MASATLLIIAHGSRSEVWNDAIREFARQAWQLQPTGHPFSKIACAFMEHGEPGIPESIERLAQAQEPIVVMPLFLSIAKHMKEDVPQLIAQAATQDSAQAALQTFRCGGVPVRLLAPIPAPNLLAENLAGRVQQRVGETSGAGVVMVFYGTRSHAQEWDALAHETQLALQEQLAGAAVAAAYAGERADFEPTQLTERIRTLQADCEPVVIAPALVAYGKIQREVIPQAMAQIQTPPAVINLDDAVLPDERLVQRVVCYASEHGM